MKQEFSDRDDESNHGDVRNTSVDKDSLKFSPDGLEYADVPEISEQTCQIMKDVSGKMLRNDK